MINTVSAFQLGSSTVVTLPKNLGIKPGQKMKVKKMGDEIILKEERVDPIKTVAALAGGMNFKKAFGKSFTPGQLNKLYDEQYKKVLSGC